MKRFEHRADPIPIEKLQDGLKKIEADGWEAVAAIPMTISADMLQAMGPEVKKGGRIIQPVQQSVIPCALVFWKRPAAGHAPDINEDEAEALPPAIGLDPRIGQSMKLAPGRPPPA